MFRLCVIQSTFANKTVLKINIREKRVSVKCKNNLNFANNETLEEKEVSLLQNTSNNKTQLNQTAFVANDNTNHEVNKQTGKTRTVSQQKEESNLLSKVESDELKNVNKFKVMENLKSSSIFGSDVTTNDGIQCAKSVINSKIPSVTYILNETMSPKAKTALELWKKNIIDTYGKDYFRVFCKGLLDEGKAFHSCIQDILSRKELEIPVRIKPAYFSVESILKEIQTVYALEAHVMHPTLWYKGVVDCIATYRDQLYVIDWKKSGKLKASLAATFDAPVQLAAYIGAVNASHEYAFRVEKGLVVVAYTNGEPASIHELSNESLQKAWDEWLRRLKQFYLK